MEFNAEMRKKQLENLEQFISTSRDKVESILNYLDWNVEDVIKDKNMVQCPLDVNHKLAAKNLEDHISKCSLRKEHYDLKEDFLSIPTHQPGQSIKIDNQKKIELFSNAACIKEKFIKAWNGQDSDPKTSNRLLSTFSSDERLVLYDYVINSTTGPQELPEFNVIGTQISENDKNLSNEELMALERDAKRRRIKYKSVYTNHKSNSEVLKEVIDSQMELYEDWIKNKTKVHKDENCKEQRTLSPTSSHTSLEKDINERSTISRNSTHSSSSKSTSRKYDNTYKNGRNSDNKKSDNEDDYRDYRYDKRYKYGKSDENHTKRHRYDREYYKEHDRKYRSRDDYYKRNGFKNHH